MVLGGRRASIVEKVENALHSDPDEVNLERLTGSPPAGSPGDKRKHLPVAAVRDQYELVTSVD